MKLVSRLVLTTVVFCLVCGTVQAERRRLNRFSSLVAGDINLTGGATIDFVGGSITAAANDLQLVGDDDLIFIADSQAQWAINDAGTFDSLVANNGIDGNTTLPISIGGSTVATFDSGGVAITPAGSASAASLDLEGGNTGLYSSANNEVSITTGGLQTAMFDTGGINVGAGSSGSPSIAFIADPDTGFYRSGTNNAAITNGGTVTWEWRTSGEMRSFVSGAAITFRSPDGSFSSCTVDNSDNFTCTGL